MDAALCSPLPLPENPDSFLFHCESLLDPSCEPPGSDPASDPGYFSAGSSLSPTSSVDSFCFSPTCFPLDDQDALDRFIFGAAPAPVPPPAAEEDPRPARSEPAASRKSRSRYPGKKRQTASEREKLRMRDLTKALHHVRSYLPAWMAPAGQTLTKIETLRLTIRYISYLSAQLGLSEEALEQRRSCGSATAAPPQTLSQFLGEEPSGGQTFASQHPYQLPNALGLGFGLELGPGLGLELGPGPGPDGFWMQQRHLGFQS